MSTWAVIGFVALTVSIAIIAAYKYSFEERPKNGGSKPWPHATPESNDFLGVRDKPDRTGVNHRGGSGVDYSDS